MAHHPLNGHLLISSSDVVQYILVITVFWGTEELSRSGTERKFNRSGVQLLLCLMSGDESTQVNSSPGAKRLPGFTRTRPKSAL